MSRLLLAAYPARLRRKHGAELIDTLAEMAGPGGRPSRAEWVRLGLDGLRERFRPPTRRPFALVVAALALVVGGALGAAAGSWLGTLGYAALPDNVAFPSAPTQGDRYLSAVSEFPAGLDARQTAEQVHRSLAAEGWRTGPIETGDGSDGVLANVHFAATSDGVRLDVYAYPSLGTVDLAGWPTRPAAYVPLTVAGTLFGLIAGWLVGVAFAHRVRAARRPVRSAVLAALGLILVVPSSIGFVAALLRYLTVTDPLGTGGLVHAHGFAFGPTIDLMRSIGMEEGSLLTPRDASTLPLLGLALIVVAAILARPRREWEAVA